MQGAGDELHRDEQRDEDGGDRPDTPAIADGARKNAADIYVATANWMVSAIGDGADLVFFASYARIRPFPIFPS